MKHILITSTLATSLLCLVMCSSTTPSAPADPSTDTPWLDQLEGTWEGPLGNMTYVEQWTKLDATTYEGVATTKKDGKAIASEQMRITLFSDHWLYLANPGGQGVTCFVRTSADASTWIFENREHDFPKRIGYRLSSSELNAWIAGKTDSDNRMDFALKRVN